MNNKVLSISIASYNAEKDISRCLESMICTSVFDVLDIIVVNDGSKDKTSEVAHKYAKKYPNSIRVIDKTNGGHGSTINTGIIEAKGKYFKIVDSDDWVDKKGLELLVDYLSRNDIDLVMNPFHMIAFSDKRKLKLIDSRPSKINASEVIEVGMLSGNEDLYMHSMTFKSDLLKQAGPIIDEHCFYVDMEYCIYPLPLVKSIVYLDYSVYQYLLGSQAQSVSLDSLVKRRNEHKKVIVSLISYYNSHFLNQNVCPSVQKLVYKRICCAIRVQYNIYLNMGSKNAKNEMDEFSEYLNKIGFVYEIFEKSYLKKLFLKLVYKSDFAVFKNLALIYRILSFIKK